MSKPAKEVRPVQTGPTAQEAAISIMVGGGVTEDVAIRQVEKVIRLDKDPVAFAEHYVKMRKEVTEQNEAAEQ